MLARIGIFIFALAMMVIVVSVVEFLVPLALGIDPADAATLRDPDALAAFMQRQPAGLFLGIVLAHGLGALVGGLVLALARQPRLSLWLFAGVATLGGLGNLFLVPGHPTWFAVLDLLIYTPAAWLGWRWVERTREVVAAKSK